MKNIKHVCAHTDDKQEACFDCKRPMTKYKVSMFRKFNTLLNSVSLLSFRGKGNEHLMLAFRDNM